MFLENIKKYKKIIFLAADIIVIFVIAWLAFLVRFEGQIPATYLPKVWSLIVLMLILSLPVFYWQKLYHFTWAYVGLNEFYRIIKAVTLSTFLATAALFIFRDWQWFSGFPRSVIFINYFLTLLAISGLRVGKRIFKETIRRPSKGGRRVLIIGAGSAGEELSRSISKTRGYNLIGFVDDSATKQNTTIHGYPVLGKRLDLSEIVKKFKPEEVIIALPSVAPKIIRETTEICRQTGIPKIKILPSLYEIITGKASLSNVREISIEDLLGREPVQIDTQAIQKFIFGKIVLVTGGAGSIGSHLCQQILKFSPAKLIVLDQNETGIFHLENNLNKEASAVPKIFEIGDICDENKIDWLFKKNKPDVVLHAAAYKHVPVMEAHPLEAVKNNIFGTISVAQAAIKYNAEKFVFISTDKAVNPSSVMGATKRIGEIVSLWLNQQGKTKFCAVRFGNVLDSQGNVVGIFEEQIKKGGPVEVTHPEMKRYFMVTSEACLLVLQAGAISSGGEVFILDMGEPVKIVDLAREMIKLAGYEPDVDIPIVFSQPRPGEKLFEEILTQQESPTQYQKIFIAHLENTNSVNLEVKLKQLKDSLAKMDQAGIIKILEDLIPGYHGALISADRDADNKRGLTRT